MSTALLGLHSEEVSCPRSPAMKPLKFRALVHEHQDSLRLPEKANASASKRDLEHKAPRREKKTIMNFLLEREGINK